MESSTRSAQSGIRRRWIVLATLVAGLAIVLAAAATLYIRAELDPGAPVVGVSNVIVEDNRFAPAAIQVPAGTTVSWQWAGGEEHNVVGDAFESPTQADGSFSHTFSEPGTHAYECTLHFFMRGEVVVTD